MRAIDSPAACNASSLVWKRLRNTARRERIFKGRPTYKESEPYVDDYYTKEDAFNFMVTLPPSMG